MKYVIIFSLPCLLFIIQFLSAQAPDTLWTKKYGGSSDDKAYGVKQTTDGGYIIAANTQSLGNGLDDIWLIKTNATGDTTWTKTYGNTEYDYCYHVQQTSDDGYLLFGETNSFHHTYWFAWVIKTNSFGDTVWTSVIGEGRHYFARSGIELSGGECIFTGRTKASGSAEEDLWLVKLDAIGDTVWTKRMGGNGNDHGISIEQATGGGFIIAGVTESFGAGDKDLWLIRTDQSGDTIWTKTYGGIDSDIASDIKQTDDNGFIIAGATRSFGHMNNYYDAWLIKTDSIGDTVWTKTFGGNFHDGGLAVQQTLDGGYILVGYKTLDLLNGDVWMIRTDDSGDTLWTASFGSNFYDYGRSVEQTNDGGYIIAGEYYEYNTNSRDVWLIKTAPDPSGIKSNVFENLPGTAILNQNYPNPFNPTTTIEFDLPKSSQVTLKIYNILGEEVITLVSDRLPTGSYSYEWDASNLASGVYLYRLQAGEYVETRKMVLMR
jgi:hypothetical protein